MEVWADKAPSLSHSVVCHQCDLDVAVINAFVSSATSPVCSVLVSSYPQKCRPVRRPWTPDFWSFSSEGIAGVPETYPPEKRTGRTRGWALWDGSVLSDQEWMKFH